LKSRKFTFSRLGNIERILKCPTAADISAGKGNTKLTPVKLSPLTLEEDPHQVKRKSFFI